MPEDIDFMLKEHQRRRNEDYKTDWMAWLFILFLWAFNIGGILVVVAHILGII